MREFISAEEQRKLFWLWAGDFDETLKKETQDISPLCWKELRSYFVQEVCVVWPCDNMKLLPADHSTTVYEAFFGLFTGLVTAEKKR
jgi:hypothetical protein